MRKIYSEMRSDHARISRRTVSNYRLGKNRLISLNANRKFPMRAPYSLWLMPPLGERSRFATIIQNLSRRFQTFHFEPHITLSAPKDTTESEVLKRAREIASRLAPVPIRLENVGYTDAYFRCLFFQAEKSRALLDAHHVAATHLNGEHEPNFIPHLSLLYAENIEPTEKEEIAQAFRRELPITFLADCVCLAIIDGPPDRWHISDPLSLSGTQ